MTYSRMGLTSIDYEIDLRLSTLRSKSYTFFIVGFLLLIISIITMISYHSYNSNHTYWSYFVNSNKAPEEVDPNSGNPAALPLDGDLAGLAPKGTYTNWETNNDWFDDRSVLNYPAGKSVLDYGATSNGGGDDTLAFQSAIDGAAPGTAIIVPPGKYRISNTLRMTRGVSLRGSGSTNTHLEFVLTSTKNAIEVNNRANYNWINIVQNANIGDDRIVVANSSGFSAGDYIEIEEDNHGSFYTLGRNGNPDWAQRAIVQLTKIESVTGNELKLVDPLHHRILQDANPKVSKVNLVTGVGVEDLRLDLSQSKSWRGFNIVFWGVSNSWIIGVRADYSTRAHVLLTNSYSNLIYGNYFNDSHLHGGNLEGYGVYSVKSSKNTIENNIFKHLRHALIIAMGASGNIYGYNYSTETHAYWNNDNPSGSTINTGDISVHGWFPTLNLYEGNVAQVVAIDNGWGSNGPTTLLRNCLEKPRINQEALRIDADNYRHNVLGNILSASQIGGTSIGIDASVKDSTLLHGNHDAISGNTNWDPNLPQDGIPTTLYLDTIPPYLANIRLPLMGPESVDHCINPAKSRFEQGDIFTDSSIRDVDSDPSATSPAPIATPLPQTDTPIPEPLSTATPRPTGTTPHGAPTLYHDSEVLYLFSEGGGTLVKDYSGKTPSLDLTIGNSSAVQWGNDKLIVHSSTILSSDENAARLIDACRSTEEMSLELWIKPELEQQQGPARILTLSKDAFSGNFTVGHGLSNGTETDLFDVRLRTSATDNLGRPSLSSSNGVTSSKLTHLVYTRGTDGSMRMYIDGELDSSQQRTDSLSTWDPEYRLALANENDANRPWLGEYHLVAVYCRELESEEVAAHFLAGPEVDADPVAPTSTPIAPTATPEPTTVPTQQPGSQTISGELYIDSNGNGIQDSNEQPLAGVIVLLVDFGSEGQVMTLTTTSNPDGKYVFTNVPTGDYIVSFALPPEFSSVSDLEQISVRNLTENVVLPSVPVNLMDNQVYLPLQFR